MRHKPRFYCSPPRRPVRGLAKRSVSDRQLVQGSIDYEGAISTVDVFTDRRFGGNPVAVISDQRGLSSTSRWRESRGWPRAVTRPRWRRWSVPSQSKSCAGEANRPRSATPQKRRCLQAPHPGACSCLLHAQQEPAIPGLPRLGRPSESRDLPRLPAPLPAGAPAGGADVRRSYANCRRRRLRAPAGRSDRRDWVSPANGKIAYLQFKFEDLSSGRLPRRTALWPLCQDSFNLVEGWGQW
jgi:hypothetical protein